MKKIILLFTLFIGCSIFAQSPSHKISDTMMTTGGGTTLGINTVGIIPRGNSSGKASVSICHFGPPSTYLVISEEHLPVFYHQLRQIQDKYEEWIGVAITNNVKDLVKAIPISISYDSVYVIPLMSSTTSSSIIPYFYLQNGKVALQLKLSMSCYQTHASDEWWFWDGDIDKLIDTIEKTIRIDKDIAKQRTEIDNLFN